MVDSVDDVKVHPVLRPEASHSAAVVQSTMISMLPPSSSYNFLDDAVSKFSFGTMALGADFVVAVFSLTLLVSVLLSTFLFLLRSSIGSASGGKSLESIGSAASGGKSLDFVAVTK